MSSTKLRFTMFKLVHYLYLVLQIITIVSLIVGFCGNDYTDDEYKRIAHKGIER